MRWLIPCLIKNYQIREQNHHNSKNKTVIKEVACHFAYLIFSSMVWQILCKATEVDFAPVAQLVEHILGKDEVSGSIPVGGLDHRVNNIIINFS